MIINQKDNNIQLPNDSLKYDINSKSNSEFITNLMSNPNKYREFKENINRINYIENEINLIKAHDNIQKINFAKILIIELEDYKSSMNDSKEIIESLSDNDIIDITSHKKLLSFEKHILEIYSYLLGDDYFDWKRFRETFNLSDAKFKMTNINYSSLSTKKINMLLNKISRDGKGKYFLENYIFPFPGLELIYEWVRCQIKIFFYLIQNNLISNNNKNLIRSKTYTNIGTNTVNPFNLMICNKKLYLNKNSNDKLKKSGSMNNIFIEKKNMTTGYVNKLQNSKNNILITGLPNLNYNNTSSKINNIVSIYFNKYEKKKPKKIKNQFIKFSGINQQKEFEKKEEKNIELLPFVNYRTFHQMRKYYKMETKEDEQINKRHFRELQLLSSTNKNNIKILSKLGNNKIEILKHIPLFKIKEIIEET